MGQKWGDLNNFKIQTKWRPKMIYSFVISASVLLIDIVMWIVCANTRICPIWYTHFGSVCVFPTILLISTLVATFSLIICSIITSDKKLDANDGAGIVGILLFSFFIVLFGYHASDFHFAERYSRYKYVKIHNMLCHGDFDKYLHHEPKFRQDYAYIINRNTWFVPSESSIGKYVELAAESIRVDDSLKAHDDSVAAFKAHIRDSINRFNDSLAKYNDSLAKYKLSEARKEKHSQRWKPCIENWKKCIGFKEYLFDEFGHDFSYDDSVIVDVKYKVLNRYPANQSCIPFTNKCSYNEEKYEFKITSVKKVRIGDLKWVSDNQIRKDISEWAKEHLEDRYVSFEYTQPVIIKILESIAGHDPIKGKTFIEPKSELKEVCDWDGCRYVPEKKFRTAKIKQSVMWTHVNKLYRDEKLKKKILKIKDLSDFK